MSAAPWVSWRRPWLRPQRCVCCGRYPKLCCRYKESSKAGEDVFLKFSAVIKNPNPAFNERTHVSRRRRPEAGPRDPMTPRSRDLRLWLCVPGLWKNFYSTLEKLNTYLATPLPYELDRNPDAAVSSRRFLDGDALTLADCNLLPKLHVVKVRRRRPWGLHGLKCVCSGGVSGVLRLRRLWL